jgi:phospholipid/cholesterol/gamma-HCH transport system substrate-binding protein
LADRSEVRAGVFVILALAILVAGTIWIVGFTPFRGPKATYDVLMKSSAGVRKGDRVRVSGIEVGRVKAIELRAGDEWPVVFRVAMDEDVALTAGSAARITSDGILGAPYLEIVAGPGDGQALPPGSRIVGTEGGTLMEALEGLGGATDRLPFLLDEATALAGALNRELTPLLGRLKAVLSDRNVEEISGTLATLRPLLEEVGPRASDLLSRLDSLAAQIEDGVNGVPELTDEATALVGELRQAIGPGGGRLAGLLDSAERTLGAAESTFGTADGAFAAVEGNSAELDAMLRDLREAAANLRSLSQTLKERPSLLLRYPRPAERKPGEEEKR